MTDAPPTLAAGERPLSAFARVAFDTVIHLRMHSGRTGLGVVRSVAVIPLLALPRTFERPWLMFGEFYLVVRIVHCWEDGSQEGELKQGRAVRARRCIACRFEAAISCHRRSIIQALAPVTLNLSCEQPPCSVPQPINSGQALLAGCRHILSSGHSLDPIDAIQILCRRFMCGGLLKMPHRKRRFSGHSLKRRNRRTTVVRGSGWRIGYPTLS